ncbi:MAG: SDR family NAD(P)-dependent oxidoreductase [Parvibaculaceae bacterium]
MRGLRGRNAIVIGAALGIGKGIAKRLVEDGAEIVIADRDAEKGRITLAELGLPEDRFVHADVSSENDVERLVRHTIERFERIDILVQNAGIYPVSLIEETSLTQWDRVQSVNLRGTFLATRACTPIMKRQRHGRLIFTSSITGPKVVSHGLSSYAATKAGINGFIKVAALELAAFGITANGVEPGNILTEGLVADRSPEFIGSMERSIPMGRLGTPSDIAGAVAFLASDDAAYITGTTIVVDGGQTLPENKDFLDAATWA